MVQNRMNKKERRNYKAQPISARVGEKKKIRRLNYLNIITEVLQYN